jgi:hypothetical protein
MLTAMRPFAAAVLLVSSAAHADVTAEVTAGAGAQADSTAYATASALLAAEYSHPSAPLYRRGLAAVDDDGGVWIWTGAGDGERDGIRADVSATALGSTELGAAHAAARGIGWELDLGVAYQPVGDLREQFWRSGRGMIASSFGFQIPAMVTFGNALTRFSMGDMTVAFTSHTLRSGGESTDGGLDADVAVHFIRWHERRYALDLLDIHVGSYEKIASASLDSTTGVSSTDFGIDGVRLDFQLAPALTLTASAGADNLAPMAAFSDTTDTDGTMTATPVPSVWSPRYWLELDEHTDASKVSAGAGSWARLDPTGNAADAGQLASASYDRDFGRLHVHASAEAGRLVRRMIGALAPQGLAPVGTRMWMGRGELAGSLRVARGFELTGTAWLERSDRDDPRWLVPATGAIATHAGADLSARWQLKRHHRAAAGART